MAASKASTVDYILVCRGLLSMVETLQVLPYMEGDHFPLHLSFHLNIRNLNTEPRYHTEITALEKVGCRVRWSPKLAQNLKQLLTLKNLIDSLNLVGNQPVHRNPIDIYGILLQWLNPHLVHS